MVNQKLYIINLSNLFDIINELKEHLDIDLFKYDERKVFLDKFEKKEISLKNSMIIVPEDEYSSYLKFTSYNFFLFSYGIIIILIMFGSSNKISSILFNVSIFLSL